MAIIEVENVTKAYNLGQLHSLKQSIRNAGKRLRGQTVEEHQPFKALDNVSFSIERGEVVGIVGHNGAGKSTLLKLLSRITTPTSGSVRVNGRVAPLIEVGAGLVGDMTGRENIYLNGSILGLKRREIDEKIDEIIEFSELERFIDTPLKRFSSGMQVRLGYAIATAIDSEILIVDEVLAVGDLQFQRKSIERMQRLIEDNQRTVLVVGHNVRQLERICSRMIMMDHGKLIADDTPEKITNLYFDMAAGAAKAQIQGTNIDGRIESSGEIEVRSVRLMREAGGPITDQFEVGEGIVVELEIESKKILSKVDMGIAFHTGDLMNIGISPLTASLPVDYELVKGRNIVRCKFKRLNVLPGLFMLKIAIKDSWGQVVWNGDNIHPFHIVPPEGTPQSRYSSITFVEFEADWEIEHTTISRPAAMQGEAA